MKNASSHVERVVNSRRFKGRTLPVSALIILAILVSASFFSERASAKRMTSSLITQIGFNPVNQPANFTAGVPNPASRPLRIQTQNSSGTGENVTGDGQTVLVTLTTTSPTGRFSNSAAGPFNSDSITVSITSGRQNSQDIFYLDTTPGTVAIFGTAVLTANTSMPFGASTAVIKSVVGASDRLAFGTQPANALKDAIIAPPVTVRIQDASGNLDTAANRNVVIGLGNDPTGATLSGTTTVAAVNGIATFSNLSINKAGSGYTLVASSDLPTPALITAESTPFNINKLPQTIDFEELENKTFGDEDFELHAASSTGSDVVFESLAPEVCSVTGGIASIAAAGVCAIRASHDGDNDHDPAEDVERSFFINKADASIVVNPYDVVYDGQPHTATLVSITGVKGETDSLVGTVDLAGTAHTDAGSYARDTWSFVGSGNYNDASGTLENNISKAPITAQAGTGTAVFDGNEKSVADCGISGSGFVGDLSCANDPGSVGPGAGSYVIGSTVSGSGLSNFEITKLNGTFTIEKANTAVTVIFENGPYAYRGSGFAATARVSGPGGLDQSIPVTYSGDCLNVTVTHGCTATGDFAENANYSAGYGSSSITISKRPLNVTASSHSIMFGAAAPSITPSFDGFVAGESASVIDAVPTCSTDYVAGSPIGSYTTTCAGGQDNNYSFSQPYAAGTLVVNSTCSSFSGFLPPIGGANAFGSVSGSGGSFNSPLRTFKLNSTIPFKFTAVCSGSPLSSGIQTLSAQKYNNGVPVGDEVLAFEEDDTSADNQFRFSEGQWHFNFKTKELGDAGHGTWLFEVRLFDGSRYGVWLAIKR